MKWEIAIAHWNDHFWFGTGLGRFTWYYPQWQAQYFQTHSNPPLEYFLSAGESYIIFNEYLQLFKEVGLIGIIVTTLLFFYFFISKSTKYRQLLNTVKATVIALLACCFTSYSFHVNVFLLLLFICFVIAITIRENKTILSTFLLIDFGATKKVLLFLTLTLSIYASFSGIKQLVAVTQWNKLRDNPFLSYTKKKMEYAGLYPSLKDNGKFLTEYGEYLKDNGDCFPAAELLERAKKSFISRRTIEAAGYAYWCIKDYRKAIENFEWLSNYLPNRFEPKFALLKLYEESGQKSKAAALGKTILTMPVKIPSTEVQLIKLQTKNVLRNL